MTLDELTQQTGEWLRGIGPHSDIVVSSRIRLARNLEKAVFPQWATPVQREQVRDQMAAAMARSKFLKGALFLEMKSLSEVDRNLLVERHLISREHAAAAGEKAVLIGDREILAIMVNEEDHLRLQVLQSGFNLSEAWTVLLQVNEELESKLTYAFLPEWGYLTACPTNVGTGLRASCMLHLPCLVMTKQIGRVLHAIAKLGLTARGLYGEGTEASGNFFQLSNQVTLGVSEEETLDNLERLIRQVMDQEQAARRALMSQSQEALADRIWRAYGTLKTAHLISSTETVNLLSLVRLGVDLNVIPNVDRGLLNRLFIQIQPAHLQKISGQPLSTEQRDSRRAKLLRDSLS